VVAPLEVEFDEVVAGALEFEAWFVVVNPLVDEFDAAVVDALEVEAWFVVVDPFVDEFETTVADALGAGVGPSANVGTARARFTRRTRLTSTTNSFDLNATTATLPPIESRVLLKNKKRQRIARGVCPPPSLQRSYLNAVFSASLEEIIPASSG
jgi:hypothetical protein